MSVPTEQSVEIFCSYSHVDEPLRKKFEPIIVNLKNHYNLRLWHDRNITAGTDWAGEIDKQLNSADIVTLLVSADFLASRYCCEKEMGSALEKEARNELLIVPIIVRSCDWEDTQIRRFQALPEGGCAITSWQNQDEAWTNVSKALKKVIALALTRKLEKVKEMAAALPTAGSKFEQPPVVSREQEETWKRYLTDAEKARTIYSQISDNAEAQQIRRWLIQTDMQLWAKIAATTSDVAATHAEKADKSFNNMDAFIRG